MSIEKMSATLRKEILSRLQKQYQTSSGRTADKRLDNFLDYTSSDRIRADTDTKKGRHESIMSRGAFLNLSEDINKVLQKSSIAGIIDKNLKSDITFDSFKDYVINTVGISLGKNLKRKAGEFTYTGASRRGEETGLTIATATKEGEPLSERDVLIFRNLPIGKLKEYYAEFLVSSISVAEGYSKTTVLEEIKNLLNSGHLTGVFNARLVRALGLSKNTSGNIVFDNNSSISSASLAEQELNKIMKLVTDADYLTSNIVNDIDLFITTDKRLYKNKVELRLTTEVQFARGNQEAGNLLKQAGSAVTALTKSVKEGIGTQGQELAVGKAVARLYKSLDSLAKFVKNKVSELQSLESGLNQKARQNLTSILNNVSSIEKIIESEGSRSIPQHIEYLVESILKGTSISEQTTKFKLAEKIVKINRKKQDTTKISGKIKKLQTKTSSKKVAVQIPQQNIVNLLDLLNSQLFETIKRNMGTGNSRSLLNYRSGRLAQSVKVERLSESRQGMITAFYTYMKNPYATFSQGGRQEFPRSRDPKLLISKSIREIAQTIVGNRLRAVNV